MKTSTADAAAVHLSRTRRPGRTYWYLTDPALKENAIARTAPLGIKPGRYRPPTRCSHSSKASDYVEQISPSKPLAARRIPARLPRPQHNQRLDIQPTSLVQARETGELPYSTVASSCVIAGGVTAPGDPNLGGDLGCGDRV